MTSPDKKYYSIQEVADEFELKVKDLLDHARDGQINLSVYFTGRRAYTQTDSGERWNDGSMMSEAPKEKYFEYLEGFYSLHKSFLINSHEIIEHGFMLNPHFEHEDNKEWWYQLKEGGAVPLHDIFISKEEKRNFKALGIDHEGQQPIKKDYLIDLQLESIVQEIAKKKGGRKKTEFTEAVEYAYTHLYNKGETEILRPFKIREFMVRLKEFADELNQNTLTFVNLRIDSVKKKGDKYVVITGEKVIKISRQAESIRKSKTYGQNAVSKIMTSMRREYPL